MIDARNLSRASRHGRMSDCNVSSTSNRADDISYDVTINLMITAVYRANISGLTVFQYLH